MEGLWPSQGRCDVEGQLSGATACKVGSWLKVAGRQ